MRSSITSRRMLLSIAVLLAALPVAANRAAGDDARTKPVERTAKSVLRERVVILEKLLRLRQRAFSVGESTLDVVLRAKRTLLAAQLELAESPKERVRIRQESLRNLVELEKILRSRVETGDLPPTELLEATAARLRAEADLLAEQSPKE